MSCELISVELTEMQKADVCGILTVGCDRQTAADFVGCSLADIRRAMQQDAQFLARICHAEAGSEVSHMQNVKEAAKDVKNWRASVWWLERRSPELYGGRTVGVVTSRQLKAFVAILVGTVGEDIRDAADRERFVARLRALSESVDQMLLDERARPNQFDALNNAMMPDGVGDEPDDASDETADEAWADAEDGRW